MFCYITRENNHAANPHRVSISTFTEYSIWSLTKITVIIVMVCYFETIWYTY